VVRHSLQAAAAAAVGEPAAAAGEEHTPLAAARLVVPLQVAHKDTPGLPLDTLQAGMLQPEAVGPRKQGLRLALLMLPAGVPRTPQEAALPALQSPLEALQPLRQGKERAHTLAGAFGRGRAAAGRLAVAASAAAAAVGAASRGMLRPAEVHLAQRRRARARLALLEGVRYIFLVVERRRGPAQRLGTVARPLGLGWALAAAGLAGLGSTQETCCPPHSCTQQNHVTTAR
jgi:hypothetical protein